MRRFIVLALALALVLPLAFATSASGAASGSTVRAPVDKGVIHDTVSWALNVSLVKKIAEGEQAVFAVQVIDQQQNVVRTFRVEVDNLKMVGDVKEVGEASDADYILQGTEDVILALVNSVDQGRTATLLVKADAASIQATSPFAGTALNFAKDTVMESQLTAKPFVAGESVTIGGKKATLVADATAGTFTATVGDTVYRINKWGAVFAISEKNAHQEKLMAKGIDAPKSSNGLQTKEEIQAKIVSNPKKKQLQESVTSVLETSQELGMVDTNSALSARASLDTYLTSIIESTGTQPQAIIKQGILTLDHTTAAFGVAGSPDSEALNVGNEVGFIVTYESRLVYNSGLVIVHEKSEF